MTPHERELTPLIERYAVLKDVEAYFHKRYGYTPKAVSTILDAIGCKFPEQWAMDYTIPR